MVKRFLLTTVSLIGIAGPLAAQNLADVARAEEARRRTVMGRAKVYTNETLRGPDGGSAPPAPVPGAAAPPVSTAKPAAPEGTTPPTSATDAVKNEKFWRDSLASAREAINRSQTFADALQSQINALYAEFVNMSDPAQRAVIEQKRLAAIAEQDRVRADMLKQGKALSDIEDEARRANVPAGWLR